jgi:hypothetical protein
VDELFVTVIDTVSGQIVYRSSILHGEGPTNVVIIENNIIVSYWNGQVCVCCICE